ncbi:MAG: HPr family phosphocarrier protein [Spirochaetales bacterium]|nr:HPr family phosphocarrier protein [Spirochaetales bacterium]MDY5055920.1 HPr family phosphocarrier protein [Bullifex sp.]MDY5907537.1 HPr family phosphocarrier protein [Bullifex sp.]
MVSGELTVENRAGIHTRPAGQIVKTASRFRSDIFFIKDDMRVNGKSIMGIITLGATYRTKLTCECTGEDEKDLFDAVKKLFLNRFEAES